MLRYPLTRNSSIRMLSTLIEQEQVETPQYVTVSVNEEFIDQDDFDSHVLKDGDEVEFLYFMGGGR